VLLHNARGAVRLLWSRVRFTSLCAVMKLRIKKILTDFCDTRTRFAALARACFHESQVWDKYSCEYAAHVSRNASHSLRSHSTCHSLIYVPLLTSASSASRDRVINAPCALPLRGFSPPVPGSIFASFFRSYWRSIFRHFFAPHTTFFVIDIIINTSLTSSHHQNLLSARHEIVKTRQHTKNGQKWLFLRVSKIRLKMGVFGLFLTSSKNHVF
jgi:hypothetical protein